MYFSLFTLSQNKTKSNHDCELAHHTWKMLPHYLIKCRTHSPDGRCIVSLQTLAALKRAGCVMWQLECQESNVTATIYSTWTWAYHWVFGASLRLAPALSSTPKVWLTPTTRVPCSKLQRHETRWNVVGCPKLDNKSQPLVDRSSPYCKGIWGRYCSLRSFFRLSTRALVVKI